MLDPRNYVWLFALVPGLILGACTKMTDPEEPPPAQLSGAITDLGTNGPLANVIVTAASETVGDLPPASSGQSTSGPDGTYRIVGLDANITHRISARASGFDTIIQSLKTAEGENTLPLSMQRSRVCTPGSTRCTTPPAPAAILTCNESGTEYTTAPCGAADVCDIATTRCGKKWVVAAQITKSGGDGRITSVPDGIACPPDCGEEVFDGTHITLTPLPLAGDEFKEWAGDCSGSGVCEADIHANFAARAIFIAGGPRVTVTKTGLGSGTIVSTPAGINCGAVCAANFAQDERVTLVVTPTSRGVFDAWTNCTPTNLPRCQVTVSGPVRASAAISAFFEHPLRREAACHVFFAFENNLSQACGTVAPAVVTGTVSFAASRNMSLGQALVLGGASIETLKPGVSAMMSTVEMAIHRLAGGVGPGTLYSDMADPGSPGVALIVEDDGRLRGVTRNDMGMETEVASMMGAIAVGTWYHVELLVDATRGLRLKIDDVLVGETMGAPSWTATSSTAWLGAARDGSGGSTDRFIGRLDNVQMGDYGRQ